MAADQITVKLFSTEFCHLCETAEEIVRSSGIEPVIIEIVDDDNLYSTYGMRIPVLKRMDNGAELDWPFDAASVSRFILKTEVQTTEFTEIDVSYPNFVASSTR